MGRPDSRVNMNRDAERTGPRAERKVFADRHVQRLVEYWRVPGPVVLGSDLFEHRTMNDQERAPGSGTLGDFASGPVVTSMETLLTIWELHPVEDRRCGLDQVSTSIVNSDFAHCETESTHDGSFDRVGCLEEAIDTVSGEPHVGIDPEQPVGITLGEERVDCVVAGLDDAACPVAGSEPAAADDVLLMGDVPGDQCLHGLMPGVGDLVAMHIGDGDFGFLWGGCGSRSPATFTHASSSASRQEPSMLAR